VVVEADDACQLSFAILVLPELNELSLAYRLGIVMSRVMETMHADLHGAIVGDGIDLKGSGNELAGDFAADVVFDAIDCGLLAAAEAADIVVELQIVVQQGRELFQVTVVVRVEELCIQ
jgi:hypothetical protein